MSGEGLGRGKAEGGIKKEESLRDWLIKATKWAARGMKWRTGQGKKRKGSQDISERRKQKNRSL